MSWSHRAMELGKSGLVLLALAAAFAIVIGLLGLSHQRTCDRLDAQRVSHLLAGHETRGRGSMYVIGIGPGPPPSQIIDYWEDEAAMERAGCDVPGE